MKFTSRLLAIAACALVFASCTDDVSEEYSKMSGRTYIGAPEVSDIIPGFEKYQIKWSLNTDPRINKARVSWADDAEFVLLNIERIPGDNGKVLNVTLDNEGTEEKYRDSEIVLDKDTIYLKVNHVFEGAHLVNVTHLGENETSSLIKEIPVSVYGANYQNTLRERPLTNIVSNINETIITWSNRENCTGVKLTYTKHDGEEVTQDIPRSETITKLPYAKSESTIKYYSYYLPVPSLDQISTVEPFEVEVPNIFQGVKIKSMSYTEDGATINWDENCITGVVNIFLNYISHSGDKKILEINDFENLSTTIVDARAGSQFTYVTYYRLPGTEKDIVSEPQGSEFPVSLDPLDNSKFVYLDLPGDATPYGSKFKPQYMFDGITYSTDGNLCFHTAKYDYKRTVSIDLGKVVKLSKIRIFQRGNDGRFYKGNNLKSFTLYGTTDISSDDKQKTTTIRYETVDNGSPYVEEEHEIPDLSTYDLILENAMINKPSGNDNLTITDEDKRFGREEGHIIEISEDTPAVRYLRLQLIDTWGDLVHWYAIGEFDVWGIRVE